MATEASSLEIKNDSIDPVTATTDTQPLTVFHKFSSLNQDCRELIWKQAIMEYTVLEVKVEMIDPNYDQDSVDEEICQVEFPIKTYRSYPTMRVSQEARDFTLKLNQAEQITNPKNMVYIRAPHKLLKTLSDRHLGQRNANGRLNNTYGFDTFLVAKGIKNLVVDVTRLGHKIEQIRLVKAMRHFRELETLTIIMDNGYTSKANKKTLKFLPGWTGMMRDSQKSHEIWHPWITDAYQKASDIRKFIQGEDKKQREEHSSTNTYRGPEYKIRVVRRDDDAWDHCLLPPQEDSSVQEGQPSNGKRLPGDEATSNVDTVENSRKKRNSGSKAFCDGG